MFLTVVGLFLVIFKFTTSIMILLLTFIAHSLYNYINSKLMRLEHTQTQARMQTNSNSNSNQFDSSLLDTCNETNSASFHKLHTTFTEPEIFLFNESFDLNLLNLKKRKSINSINNNDDEDSFLINNLNKLYKNEMIEFDNDFNFDDKSINFSTTYSLDLDTMVVDQECLETSNYADIGDSIFNSILFDESLDKTVISTPIEQSSPAETLLTRQSLKLDRSLNLGSLCFSLGLLSQDVSTQSSSSFNSVDSMNSTSSSESRKIRSRNAYRSLKRSLALRSKARKGQIRLNKSLDQQDSSILRHKKFRNRFQRIKETKKFYQRRQRTISLLNQTEMSKFAQNDLTSLNTEVDFETQDQQFRSYKPSFKVEKLLNDTRGMKKYLIDYDCLMSQQKFSSLSTNFNGDKRTISLNDLNSILAYDLDSTSLISSAPMFKSFSNYSNSFSSFELDKVFNSNENSLILDRIRSSFLIFNNHQNGASLKINEGEEKTIQLNNAPNSNRCSSGYLSDEI